MSKRCDVCGKGPVAGRVIKQRGMPKKKGGVGVKTTGISKRVFFPNLHKIKALIKGRVMTIKICAKCLKRGAVQKA